MKKYLTPIAILFSGLLVTQAVAGDCGSKDKPTPTILEVVTFKLASGVNDEDFLKIVDKMEQNFLCNSDGIVRRTISKDDKENWIDTVEWADTKAAMGAMEASMKEATAAPFLQAIDPNSIVAKHWNITLQTQ